MANLYDLAGSHDSDDGTLTLDYFTQQFGKKTQYADFYEPKAEEPAPGDISPDLIDPEHETGGADGRPGDGIWHPSEEEKEPVSPERFAKTGKNIARLIDTGFDFTASNLIAKGSGKSYHASEKDLDDIAEAWSEIAEDKQWDLGPGWRLLLLYVVVYGPLTKQAFDDRRILELERRADETEEKLRRQDEQIRELENKLYRRSNASADNAAVAGEAQGAKA